MTKRNILFAFLFALLALIISYVSTNLNIVISGERDVLKYWSIVDKFFSRKPEKTVPDDVLFINVSYDKQIVERTDEWGDLLGNAAITDRKKLADLLGLIQTVGNYEYVLLDVFFEKGFVTEYDSLLFERIASMDRIVIPRHVDGTLASDLLVGKAAYADFTTTLREDNFTKYPLLTPKTRNESFPLKMYSEITGRTVKKFGPIYTDKACLSRRVIFPKMYVQDNGLYPIYMNLGVELLDSRNNRDWNKLFGNKIIVIGSFVEDDIHLTYAGFAPGCVINYNVFASLMRGQHRISVLLLLAYFMVFFVMAWLMLRGDSANSQSLAWIWAKLFVLYSVVLTIACILVFEVWGQAHDVFITSTFFSLVDTGRRWINNRKKNA